MIWNSIEIYDAYYSFIRSYLSQILMTFLYYMKLMMKFVRTIFVKIYKGKILAISIMNKMDLQLKADTPVPVYSCANIAIALKSVLELVHVVVR